jgi:hypothetical protein
MLAEVSREPVAVLRNARSRRRMLANERGRGVRHEFGTDKPHRSGEPFDQRAGQARHIVAPVNRESMFGMRASQKKWPDRGDVSFDDSITNACLDIS